MKSKWMVLTLLAAASPAATAGALDVSGCWIRALPDNAAGYFTLANGTDQAVELTGVEAAGYGMAMLHRSVDSNGMMKMEMVDAATVPAHGKLAFAPGGYHVMLMQPSKPAVVGAKQTLELRFKSGSSLKAECVVKGPDAMGPD